MSRPFLLFDFDGTIADSLHFGLSIVNKFALSHGLTQINEADIIELQNLSSMQALKRLKIPIYKIPYYVSILLHEYKQQIYKLQPFPDIVNVLNELKNLSIPMALITSNSKSNVVEFLQSNTADVFNWIEGGAGIFQKHIVIKHQIKKHGLKDYDIYYIGDETRDIIAARKCHIKIISVSWGFQSYNILSQFDPDFIANSPFELLHIASHL